MRSDQDGMFGELTDGSNIVKRSIKVEDYTSDMTLYSLDEYDKPTMRWIYSRAFPTNLDSIKFSERQSDGIECAFTFQFSRMICEVV